MSLQNIRAWCRQLFREPTSLTNDRQPGRLPLRVPHENASLTCEDLESFDDAEIEESDAQEFSVLDCRSSVSGEQDMAVEAPSFGLPNQSHEADANNILERDALLLEQIAELRERESKLRQQLDSLSEQVRVARERTDRLKVTVQEQRAKVVQANERALQVKERLTQRITVSADQISKLKASVQEKQARVLQANERTAHIKSLMQERSVVQKEKLAASREKLVLKNSYYDAAKRYIGIYRQGLLFDEAVKSDVDFGADAYLCLLPSTVPAGLSLSRLKGGRVYCDCVENVEVHKHSLAPNVHPPTLELMNLAAFGSLMAVDGMLTVGNAVARTLARFGPPVHVAPNFRRLEEPTPANELRAACGLGPDDKLLFASGNVVVGFEPVVRALAKLPSNIHLAAFVKLKPAIYETAVLNEITSLGIADRIHFFDFVEYSRLAALAADADIGLITSDVSNPNGAVALPNRLFDYLTAGLPVIAPPMPDVVDIIQEYGFGRTLEQVTAENWAEAIAHVLKDRQEFKDAALKARSILTWENGEEDLVNFLGNPKSVTLIGLRDLSRYQRFLRVASTLSSRGIKVKALFLADDPAPVNIPGAEYYYFSNRYGLGDGPTLVPDGR